MNDMFGRSQTSLFESLPALRLPSISRMKFAFVNRDSYDTQMKNAFVNRKMRMSRHGPMRMIIIADSLGMPRANTPVDKLWTSKIIRKYGKTLEIFTFLARSVTTNDVVNMKNDLFVLMNPDIIVFHVGIVDCVRRAQPILHVDGKAVKIFYYVPIVNRIVHSLTSRYHYALSKAFEFREVPYEMFDANLKLICRLSEEMNIHTAFIEIADAGDNLAKKIYNCQNDIERYNALLHKHIARSANLTLIEPYNNFAARLYVDPEDGHHLNENGHELVFKSVSRWLDEDIKVDTHTGDSRRVESFR